MSEPTAPHPHTGAFLALWNGISDPARQAEYEAWHTFEHVPERVGLPGFLWARRYASLDRPSAPDRQGAYFTLYALESAAALHTPAYHDVLERPTAWSARMRGLLSDFCREPCEAMASCGDSSGAMLATLRMRLPAHDDGARLEMSLQALVGDGYAVRAGWGKVAADRGHPLDQAMTDVTPTDMQAVVLLEHIREAPLRAAADRLANGLIGVAGGFDWRAAPAFFQLQSVVERTSLANPLFTRQPPRPDLQSRFQPGDAHP